MATEAEKQTPEQETEQYEVFLNEADDPQVGQKEGGESADPPKETGQEGEEGEDGKKPENEEETAEGAGESRPKKKADGRVQKRINRLTKRMRQLEEENERLKSQGEPAGKETPDDLKEPDVSDFEDYDEYLEKLGEWKAARKAAKKPKPAKEESAKKGDGEEDDKGKKVDQEYLDALDDVQDSFEEARSQYDDFDDVITADDLSITPEMVKAMAECDNPGAVAYYLGKHKTEASEIAGMTPLAQARAIGKLEAKAEKPKPGKRTTEAPDPIEPVKGSDSSAKKVEDMDFTEYEQTMNERERQSGGFW